MRAKRKTEYAMTALLLLLLFTACAVEPAPRIEDYSETRAPAGRACFASPAADEPPDRAEITIVKRLPGGEEETLPNGAVLTERDSYAVYFTMGGGLHAYLFQADEGGRLSRLHPNPEYSESKNPVAPACRIRLPANGRWFQLDDHRGRETFILLGYETALSQAEQLCRHVLSFAPHRGPGGTRKWSAPLPEGVEIDRVLIETRFILHR